jgi:AraC-like ligand binding domain
VFAYHTFQIVYVTEGEGYFESEISHRKQRVESGSVLILFPGIWHRHSPDPQTGWVENWIEASASDPQASGGDPELRRRPKLWLHLI